MARQRVLEPGDGESNDEYCKAEQHGADPAVGAAGDQIAGHTDDGGACVPSPGELVGRRDQQNRDTDNHRDYGGTSQLDDGNDAIGLGKLAVMHETTSYPEREHVRDCETNCGAPHQPQDVPRYGNDILQGCKRGYQADGNVEGMVQPSLRR